MTDPTLVVLAAGAARRFGALKQLEPLGPSGQSLLDYSLFDAARAGFGDAVLVVRPELEDRFRAHFAALGNTLPVSYAHQTLATDVSGPPSQGAGGGHGSVEVEPQAAAEGMSAMAAGATASGRTRPWGTGHAVLCAQSRLSGPFAVLNADDFYGADALARAGTHLRSGAGHGLVTYRLDRTLAPTGGVSRALCRVAADGDVESIEELSDVSRGPDGSIRGVRVNGSTATLTGAEPISMNLWAFDGSVLLVLRRRFRDFLELEADDPEAEYQLPSAVGAALSDGTFSVRALPTEAEPFGVTFPGDRTRVRDRLAALTADGEYPVDLVRRRTDSDEPGDPDRPGPARSIP